MIKSLPAKAGKILVRLKVGHFPLIGIVYQGKTGLSSFFHHRVTEEHFFVCRETKTNKTINSTFSRISSLRALRLERA
jgi:hypothetical protein